MITLETRLIITTLLSFILQKIGNKVTIYYHYGRQHGRQHGLQYRFQHQPSLLDATLTQPTFKSNTLNITRIVIKYGIIIILALIFSLPVRAQDEVQVWTGPTFRYDLTDFIRAEFEQEFRFIDDDQNYTFSEFGLRIEPLKNFYIKATYRYSFIQIDSLDTSGEDDDNWRLMGDAIYRIDDVFKTPFRIEYRFRYQYGEKKRFTPNSNILKIERFTYLRNRIKLQYNLGKLVDPYIYYENYFRFNNRNQVRQHRYAFGLDWTVNNKVDLTTQVHYQPEVNVQTPDDALVFIIGLDFDI